MVIVYRSVARVPSLIDDLSVLAEVSLMSAQTAITNLSVAQQGSEQRAWHSCTFSTVLSLLRAMDVIESTLRLRLSHYLT